MEGTRQDWLALGGFTLIDLLIEQNFSEFPGNIFQKHIVFKWVGTGGPSALERRELSGIMSERKFLDSETIPVKWVLWNLQGPAQDSSPRALPS